VLSHTAPSAIMIETTRSLKPHAAFRPTSGAASAPPVAPLVKAVTDTVTVAASQDGLGHAAARRLRPPTLRPPALPQQTPGVGPSVHRRAEPRSYRSVYSCTRRSGQAPSTAAPAGRVRLRLQLHPPAGSGPTDVRPSCALSALSLCLSLCLSLSLSLSFKGSVCGRRRGTT
jgi:hypothetical protein